MAHDVFISYSNHDKPTADAVCSTLESHGIRCWIAPRDILAGMDWTDAIFDAIATCRVFVLVLSSASNSSEQVKREVQIAVSDAMPILPLRIEEVDLSKHMKYFLGTPHWMDALTPPMEAHLQRVAKTVQALLEATSDQPQSETRPAQDTNAQPPAAPAPPSPQVAQPTPVPAETRPDPQPTPAPTTAPAQPVAPQPLPAPPPPQPPMAPPANPTWQQPVQQPYARPPMPPPTRPGPTSSNATTTLILAVVGLLCCPICSVVALVMGLTTLGAINSGRADPRQRSMVIGTIVLAAVTLVLDIIGLTLYSIGAETTTRPYYTPNPYLQPQTGS